MKSIDVDATNLQTEELDALERLIEKGNDIPIFLFDIGIPRSPFFVYVECMPITFPTQFDC